MKAITVIQANIRPVLYPSGIPYAFRFKSYLPAVPNTNMLLDTGSGFFSFLFIFCDTSTYPTQAFPWHISLKFHLKKQAPPDRCPLIPAPYHKVRGTGCRMLQ
jgi:hypothetical protein